MITMRSGTSHLSKVLCALLLLVPLASFAQLDFFIGPGYGVNYSISRIDRLQKSYETYLQSTSDNNPGIQITSDPNFDAQTLNDFLSFQGGISFSGGYFGFAFLPNTNKQSRTVMFSNNYGRRFVFTDRRYEFLFDFGYGGKFIDVFGSFGVNLNKYKMLSYTVYPDGSQSLTNEYYYNGVYRHYDGGLSYGLGMKIKPFQYLALELRYVYAHDKFPGEGTDILADNTSLSDYSDAKPVGSDSFPLDYTLGFTSDNRLTPNFRQHYFTASLVFHFSTYK